MVVARSIEGDELFLSTRPSRLPCGGPSSTSRLRCWSRENRQEYQLRLNAAVLLARLARLGAAAFSVVAKPPKTNGTWRMV
jgi:hypothetical protein